MTDFLPTYSPPCTSSRSPLARLGAALETLRRHLPQRCVLCGERGGTNALCDGCRADLPHLPATHCPVCALPGPTQEICGLCLTRPPAFDAVKAAYTYRFPMDRLILALKFNGMLSVSDLLGQGMLEVIRGASPPDLLVPMPLSTSRLRQRGFNQCTEISRPILRSLDIALSQHLCRRLRDTTAQSGLSRSARRANVRGAFHCTARVDGMTIAILDDVMTSGASLDALARALKRAGARRVVGWVVARTPAGTSALSV